MENPIKAIHKWQVDAGNAEAGYNDYLQNAYQIEEALEGFDMKMLTTRLAIPVKSLAHKDVARAILGAANAEATALADVDRFDKACDAIIFAVGSLAALRLSPQQIQAGLLIVNKANVQKLGMPRDEKGKLMKPEGFKGPEEELQKLLDKRQ